MPPANDAFASAQILTGASGSTSGTTVGATKETGEPILSDATSGASVWYEWTAPNTGAFGFETSGDLDSIIGIFTGSAVGSLTLVAQNDEGGDLSTSSTGVGPSRAVFHATSGTTYRIMVDGYNGDAQAFTLTWAPASPPANDDFANRADVASAGAAVTGSNHDATPEAGEPADVTLGAVAVWYEWMAPRDGSATFAISGTSPFFRVTLYTGSTLAGLTSLGSTDTSMTHAVVFGTTYVVRVDSLYSYGYRGDFTLTITAPALPTFTFSPVDGTAQVEVTLTGTDLQGTTSVTFGGIETPSFVQDSATQVRALVPDTALTGRIVVAMQSDVITSATDFVKLHYFTSDAIGGTTATSYDLTMGPTPQDGALMLTAWLVKPGVTVTSPAGGWTQLVDTVLGTGRLGLWVKVRVSGDEDGTTGGGLLFWTWSVDGPSNDAAYPNASGHMAIIIDQAAIPAAADVVVEHDTAAPISAHTIAAPAVSPSSATPYDVWYIAFGFTTGAHGRPIVSYPGPAIEKVSYLGTLHTTNGAAVLENADSALGTQDVDFSASADEVWAMAVPIRLRRRGTSAPLQLRRRPDDSVTGSPMLPRFHGTPQRSTTLGSRW